MVVDIGIHLLKLHILSYKTQYSLPSETYGKIHKLRFLKSDFIKNIIITGTSEPFSPLVLHKSTWKFTEMRKMRIFESFAKDYKSFYK